MAKLLNAALVIVVLIAGIALSGLVEIYTLYEITIYAVMALLSLSLAFIWGMGGIMCMGQAAFFGLGAYSYAIAAINFGVGPAVMLGIIVPTLFALALGYFMFYGRISDIYVGVITLAVTLILFNLINSTSGPQYRIGAAAIGGFNGITSFPTLAWPDGTPLDPLAMFRLVLVVLLAVYAAVRLCLDTHYGKVTLAVRENEQRAASLGHNVSLNKLVTFAIGGAIAGLAGVLFANWGAFVSPTIFSLIQSAQIIIWVIVGGRGTLLGPMLGAIALQWMSTKLGTQQAVHVSLVLGVLLTIFVLIVPAGLIPTLTQLTRNSRGRRFTNARAVSQTVTGRVSP